MLTRLTCFIIVLLSINVAAQTEWRLIKDKNNIKVYAAGSDTSNFKKIKVVADFQGTIEKLTDILLDVSKQKEWVYGTKRSYVIKKINDNELLYYVETSLPWPASNRDVALHMKKDENKTNKILNITTAGEPNAIPINNGKVRVTQFAANWKVKEVGKNKLDIVYHLFVNPGGSLPSWVVNMFIGKGPFETFSNLAELLRTSP